jgi:hypothetical protein
LHAPNAKTALSVPNVPFRERGGMSARASKEKGPFPLLGYYTDESDPDMVILCRQDGSFVAAFSSQGVTWDGIVDAAREDSRGLPGVRNDTAPSGQERG